MSPRRPQQAPKRPNPEGSVQRKTYETKGGIRVDREIAVQPYSPADSTLAERLATPRGAAVLTLPERRDDGRGVLFSSSFEFPGRYTRWDMGFVDPPLALTARGREFSVEALNERGRLLLCAVSGHLAELPAAAIREATAQRVDGEIRESATRFPEE